MGKTTTSDCEVYAKEPTASEQNWRCEVAWEKAQKSRLLSRKGSHLKPLPVRRRSSPDASRDFAGDMSEKL